MSYKKMREYTHEEFVELVKSLSEEELLKLSAAAIGIDLSEKQIKQFIKYHEILVEWNSFMNLTGIT